MSQSQLPQTNPFAELHSYIEARKGTLEERALAQIDWSQIMHIYYSAVKRNRRLLECSKESIFNCLANAVELGLTINGTLGECYAVPYAGEAQFQIGYQGMRTIALRHPKISKIDSRLIYEQDKWHVEYGTNERLDHTPDLTKNRGKWTHAYSIATHKDGTKQFKILGRDEIFRNHRAKSQSYLRAEKNGKRDSTWHLFEEAMSLKSSMRALFTDLPKDPHMIRAVQIDEDGVPPVDYRTGEILTPTITSTDRLLADPASAGPDTDDPGASKPPSSDDPGPGADSQTSAPQNPEPEKPKKGRKKKEPPKPEPEPEAPEPPAMSDEEFCNQAVDLITKAAELIPAGDWHQLRKAFAKAHGLKTWAAGDPNQFRELYRELGSKLKALGKTKDELESQGLYGFFE